MLWVCLSAWPSKLGPAGNLIVPMAWALPSLILYLKRGWFLDQALSQKWLVGLQLFRLIGGVFQIEMTRGHIPGIFAYPAGIGDIIVGILAASVLVRYRNDATLPAAALFLGIVLGLADFLSAFFFGITSSEGPLQIFDPAIPNQLILFPTGMIPLFLVPYAIFFHTLPFLNYRIFDRHQ